MAQSLAERFPSLHLTVQIDDAQPGSPFHQGLLGPRHGEANDGHLGDSSCSGGGLIGPDPPRSDFKDNTTAASFGAGSLSVTYRSAGMPQHVKDAAVYILHLPTPAGGPRPGPGPGGGGGSSAATLIRGELQGYLALLRATGGIMLVLTGRLLPQPGSPCGPEVEAVARARDLVMRQLAGEGEMEMDEVVGMIEAVGDGGGRLAVTGQLRADNNLVVALVVKHQPA
jgi:hypothetical protein